jgi:hypothetical protein
MGVVAAVGLGIAAIGTAVSIDSAQEASSLRKKVGRANAKIARLENARTRRNTIREANIATGQVSARSATSGGGGGFGNLGSSSSQGQRASIKSQLTSNLAHLDESNKLNSIASEAGIRASAATERSGTAAAIANAGLTTANLFGPGGQFA